MPFVISPAGGDTLSTLLAEVYARGFTFMNDGATQAARATRWINQAVNELANEADWSWLEATTTGSAPLSISDVRKVISVVDSTSGVELQGARRADLISNQGTDLTTTGSPTYWYLAGNTLTVYPTS